jgi:tight adherence protein B
MMDLLLAMGVFALVYLLMVVLLSVTQARVQEEHQRVQRMADDSVSDIDITRIRHVGHGVGYVGLRGVQFTEALEERMWQAGIYIPARDMLLIILICFMGGAAAGQYVMQNFLTALAAGVGAALVPIAYIQFRRRRRMAAFLKQLPYALDLIKSSLEAGNSLARSLQIIVKEFPDPLGPEFQTVLEQTKIGLSLPRALQEMLARVPDRDLRLLVVAVKVQSEVGSSLANIIGRLSDLVRARQHMRMQIRSLTAQSRISGVIVSLLPFCVLAIMSLIDPSYARTLITDPTGKLMLKAAIVMDVAAFFLIRRLLAVAY